MHTLASWRNAVAILWNLDRHELVEAGVLDAADHDGWAAFRDQPHRRFAAMDDDRAARLWTLVEPRLRAAEARRGLPPASDRAPDLAEGAPRPAEPPATPRPRGLTLVFDVDPRSPALPNPHLVDTPWGRATRSGIGDAFALLDRIEAALDLPDGPVPHDARGEDEPGPLYYADGRRVFKRPISRLRRDGGISTSLGFPVCETSDCVDEATGPGQLARLMNLGEAAVEARRILEEP